MQTIKIDAGDVLAASAAVPDDSPVFMLNLLRYKKDADYGEPGDAPCSGRTAYHERYVPVFRELAAGEGVKVTWLAAALARVVGPADEQWDEVGVVEYPSFAAFRRISESARYKAEAERHRLAALADWRLIATTPLLR